MRNLSVKDFQGGYIDRVDSNLLPPNASRNCQNFIARHIGSLEKRRGQKHYHTNELDSIQGLHAYYHGDLISMDRKLICISDGKAYYYDANTLSPTHQEMIPLLLGGEEMDLNTTQPVLFETCVHYAVAFSGVDHPWKWNGVGGAEELDLAHGDPGHYNKVISSKYPTLYKEKLFVVPVFEPSVLLWSESFQVEGEDAWPPVNYWKIRDGDGDVITCLMASFDELMIFKNRSMHILRGSHFDNFQLYEVEDRIGCVGPRAAARYRNHTYFVGYDGLYMFDGVRAINLSCDQNIGKIPRLWETLNHAYLYKAVVGVWKDTIWFALPEGSSTENNLILAYVPGEGVGTFWPFRGINASCFEVYDDASSVHFLGGGDGYVNKLDTGILDFDEPITAFWEGATFDAGYPEYEKKSRKAFVQDTAKDPVDLQISVDGGAFNSLTAMTDDRLIREYKFNSGNQWRNIVPKFVHDAEEECEVQGLLIPYRTKHRPRVKEAK